MWSSQHFESQARERGVNGIAVDESLRQIERLVDSRPSLPAILTLGHLARRVDVPFPTLRKYLGDDPIWHYRSFQIRKRSGGKRRILVPAPNLKKVQTWLAHHVLRRVRPHAASHAFAPDDSTVRCARRHASAKWLIKLDIADFFDSVTEIQVYRVFLGLGYNELVSFEMARLCTVGSYRKGAYKQDAEQWRAFVFVPGASRLMHASTWAVCPRVRRAVLCSPIS